MQLVNVNPSGLKKEQTSEKFCATNLFGCMFQTRGLIISMFFLYLLVMYFLYAKQVIQYSRFVGFAKSSENDAKRIFDGPLNFSISQTPFSKIDKNISIKVPSSSFGKDKTSTYIQNVNGDKTEDNLSTTLNSVNNTKGKISEENHSLSRNDELPQCPLQPPNLQGPLDISFAIQPQTMDEIKENNPLVKEGGSYQPPHCTSRWKVAIIIPFRKRELHLVYFLRYMHPILQRQELDYRIYVINQNGTGKFNRAKLLNVGFTESIKDDDFQCFVFHDVDLILENDKAIYSCPENPRHLGVANSKYSYHLPYNAYFGGVTEMTKEQFTKVNGHSNNYWGWGGEDDDMYKRIKASRMTIIRYSSDISRYRSMFHKRDEGNEDNPQRMDLLRKVNLAMEKDGLNSLTYKVIANENYPLYTNITVDLFGPEK
ncbi:unnamed protein product [Clavelina lepadiformis]|uniref:Beta-1,4-galactosyltransferase n=1 Tax=Clavelina lepadiformis TaxID=159417 RepID=A0ABP0GKN3_CLALP